MWEDIPLLHNKVFSHLETNIFPVNLFNVNGLKPGKKRISAILEQDLPCNLKEMQSFLGTVNAYWLMWPKCAHLLKPLSDKLGKNTFRETPEIYQAFKHIKSILVAIASSFQESSWIM